MMEHDLKDLRNLIQRVQNKFRQFPELGVSEEVKVRFSCGIKRRLSDIRERIKSLDERITNPVDCLELDNMKGRIVLRPPSPFNHRVSSSVTDRFQSDLFVNTQ